MMTTISYNPDYVRIHIAEMYDVAVGRNRLRQLADKYYLSTIPRARAAAAIYTITDLVLYKSDNPTAALDLDIYVLLENDEARGFELQFSAPFTTDISQKFLAAEWQLERACDEIGISNRGSMDHIVMRIWSKRGVV